MQPEDQRRVRFDRALRSETPDLAALLSPADTGQLEAAARRARNLTMRHFGRTISLYVPLYLSDYCGGGCAYCGFAADRPGPRRRLDSDEAAREMTALADMGFEEILLLTGERSEAADFDYLLKNVALAAARFHTVTVESFAMSEPEYRRLASAGCTGVTLYQETYDAETYRRLHRWGEKSNYALRLEAPERALSGGIRSFGMGILMGLSEPAADAIALYEHLRSLRKRFWKTAFSVSFPRVRPQAGGYVPQHPVGERFLAQTIMAFRICEPEIHLVLSTRESPSFRDGMAGIGISKMSVASRTTVGGYANSEITRDAQFSVNDTRSIEDFSAALRAKDLEPVFKDWDAVYREPVS